MVFLILGLHYLYYCHFKNDIPLFISLLNKKAENRDKLTEIKDFDYIFIKKVT